MTEMSLSFGQYGIKDEFLAVASYKATLEYSRKRLDSYYRFCDMILGYYNGFSVMSQRLNNKVSSCQNDIIVFVKEYKEFVQDFARVLNEISGFKIGYFSEVRENDVDPMSVPTYEMIGKVTKYAVKQQKFTEVNTKLKECNESIQNLFQQLKKQVKDPIVYYDSKYTSQRCKHLTTLLANQQTSEQQLAIIQKQVEQNCLEFQRNLIFFKQKLLSGKYKIHRKLYETSVSSRECLTQTLLALYDMATTRYSQYFKSCKEIPENSFINKYRRKSIRNDGKDNLSTIIINATQEYTVLIDEVDNLIKHLIDGLSVLQDIAKDHVVRSKTLVEEINKLYENNENPAPEMIDTLDLFNFFCQRLGQMGGGLHLQSGHLSKLRQNVRKHSEITLSLLKCPSKQRQPSLQQSDRKQSSNNNSQQLNNLFEQMSYDFIRSILQVTYKLIQDNLAYLKNYLNMKYHKKSKNKVEDSMELSHVEEQFVKPQKRPSQKEMWLWKEWRNSDDYVFVPATAFTKEVKTFVSALALGPSVMSGKETELKESSKFPCSLQHKKEVKGILKIHEKWFTFESSNNVVNLQVPFDHVEEINVKVQIFEKELAIMTSNGDIIFSQFQQITKAHILMESGLAAAAATGNKKSVKKISIQLQPVQLDYIAQRKEKIKNQLQPMEGYIQQGSLLIENVTVDTVYDAVYSDKTVKIKGKDEPSYLGYVMKKLGGFNYKNSKYCPPGPKFYTMEEGTTFVNCPLYSERINEYEVLLPPIPFMPKSCNSKETVKLYWISHEQFDYVIHSQSTGAPYATSFYLRIIHKIVKKEKNVEIRVLGKIVFVEDIRMKGMISSKATEEMSKNVTFMLGDVKKMLSSQGTTNQEPDKQDNQQQIVKNDDSKIKKLQNQNKLLLGILLGVFLLNLIFRIW